MALVYETMRRLDVRGPTSRGIVVDAEGAMLGPDCTLVRRTAAGYRCDHPAAASAIQRVICGDAARDPDCLFVLSRGSAKALNDGELALAQIYGLRIPIAGLDSGQLRKLAATAGWAKANFNPDQPRIPAGEPSASRITPPAAVVDPVPGSGLLLLATEERFSMDNPAHLAVADAIQDALYAIQGMLKPDIAEPPRDNPAR
ncbi:MAG: immunity 52 family protein [Alphaproteobacteria bacterium]|nr:immunity 52 family protein [Alphaproteobacteria bacterium]